MSTALRRRYGRAVLLNRREGIAVREPLAHEERCCICAKPVDVSKPYKAIHVHRGGSHAVTEEEAAVLDESSDLGMQPIGSECLRKHPELKPLAHTMEPLV